VCAEPVRRREADRGRRRDIPDGLMGLDIGPKTRAASQARSPARKTVVWNGPMGVFEWPAFRAGTDAVGTRGRRLPGLHR
jgi:phosphoglycerate kinase